MIVKLLFDSLGQASSRLDQSGTKIAQHNLKNVINLAEKVLNCSNVTRTDGCLVVSRMFLVIDNFLNVLNENIVTEDAARIISLAQIVVDDKDITWDNVTTGRMFHVLGTLLCKSLDPDQNQADNIVKLIVKFTDKLKPNDQFLVGAVHQTLDTLRVILYYKNNPSNLDVEGCMNLVFSLLHKIDGSVPNTNLDTVQNVTDLVTEVVQYYAQSQWEENIATIESCGFNIESGQIKSLDADKLKEFAGKFMAKAIQQVLFPNLSKNLEDSNQNLISNTINSQITNKEINITEKNDSVEVLNIYKSADELLTSHLNKQVISGYLANVEVSLWDKFKALPSWLWFMIRKQKLVSLDIYTRAVKHCSGDKDKTQDDNQGVKNLNLGNKDKDNSEEEISLKDKMQNVLGNQPKPKSEDGQGKDNSETLGNGD